MVDIEKVLKGLRIERECVSRDCDRDCEKCDLVQERDWLMSVYDDAISILEGLENNNGCENCSMAIEDRPPVTRCIECRYSHWVNHETGNVVCKIGHGVNPPDWFCPDGKKRYRYPGINTSLDECPLDTLVVLTDEYNNMYLGTITAKSNGQLTRGECIDGDAELFYRNKIVGWEPYHPT